MVTFVSLFLGMVFGVHPVEVLVGEDVAAVEIRLDGELVGRLEGEPWRLDCDFGELEPRELVAVSFDAEGRELNRARQWINLPQPWAEVGVVLEKDEKGRVRAARLTWESTVGADPLQVYASLDGEPLAVEDPRRIVLPPTEAQELHFLRVRMEFPQDVSAVRELPFGGTFSDETSGDLTAVLVRSEAKKLEPGDLEGRLFADGKPLRVVGVEQGPVEVVLVLDPVYVAENLPLLLRGALRQLGRKYGQNVAYPGPLRQAFSQILTLRKGTSVRWMWPFAKLQSSRLGTYEVFSPSQPVNAAREGLLRILTEIGLPEPRPDAQRLADALAAAGRTTSRERRRRAVVLLLSSEPRDASQLAPEQARSYLAKLQTPLHVWWPDKKIPDDSPWGATGSTFSLAALLKAGRRLQDDLDKQWVVWVAGLHLPHRLEVRGEGLGLRLVGGSMPGPSPDAK